MKRYYTVQEIAEILRIHPYTVARLIRTGQIPAWRVGTSPRARYRVPAEWVEGLGGGEQAE